MPAAAPMRWPLVGLPLKLAAGATGGLKPLTVSFSDNSSGTITNRFWDFGDSSTTNTTATNFNHTYLVAGTNTVSLTVSGPLGTSTLPRAGYIVVTNPPPLLTLSPANLSFGAVVIRQTNTLSFQVVHRRRPNPNRSGHAVTSPRLARR